MSLPNVFLIWNLTLQLPHPPFQGCAAALKMACVTRCGPSDIMTGLVQCLCKFMLCKHYTHLHIHTTPTHLLKHLCTNMYRVCFHNSGIKAFALEMACGLLVVMSTHLSSPWVNRLAFESSSSQKKTTKKPFSFPPHLTGDLIMISAITSL